MSQSTHNQLLMQSVNLYLRLGYSLIPVRDDKRPLFSWKTQQSFRHEYQQLENMIHHRSDVAGLGIVTGRISQLAVLDFDDCNLFHDFTQRHPQLAKTYSVRTRRGYHLYFAVPDKLNTKTRKGKGIDFLWEGCYVVAPPSIIAGFTYRMKNLGTTQRVSQADLEVIHAFIDKQSPQTRQVEPVGESTLLPEDAIRLYKQYAEAGRNDALFRVACLGRDRGWSRSTVEQILLDTFVLDNVHGEDTTHRRQEGQLSIASAFSRPPRIQLNEIITYLNTAF